ncbi:DNA-directed RNA polymerase phage-type [Penicillium cf. griseofulvum]|uniref:DNA-directed RNA polymerase n=1 Tax=Penicillium cf. griseofulvum TaxID=2972120 RepID=A0A9W9JRT9_9EURO|nr:DNA-directed RNA polymerase phage-type [Penicillium cf. griseofulvum]KAJ5431166.1 DNA-directed RNA polymerase phage-type [Penicillium cf. griseofulvum]
MLSRVACQKNAFLHFRRTQICRPSFHLPTTRFHSYSSNRNPLLNLSSGSVHDRSRNPSPQSERHLATAADHSSIDGHSPDTYDPFMHMPFESFDTSSLIILDSTPQSQSKVFRRRHGIGGDEMEMKANLELSLKIGEFERASSLIGRLGHYHPPGSDEYLLIHNRFMKQMVSYMILNRQHDMVLPLQKWFEVDMPAGGVTPDAISFAIMIRMALRMLHGSKRDRTVRRYWELAQNAGLEEELVGVEVLEDSDVGELSKICSSDMLDLVSKYMELSETTELPSAIVDDTPQVQAADQRGLGLASLKQSLSLFSGNRDVRLPENFTGTEEEGKRLLSELRQTRLETDSLDSALWRWRSDNAERQKSGFNVASDEKKLSGIMSQWHADLVARIKKELVLVDEALASRIISVEQKERCEYGVFLRALDPDRLAALTLLSVMSIFSRQGMDKGIKLSALASITGKELQDELIADNYLKKNKSMDPNRLKALKQVLANRKDKQGRLRWQSLVEKITAEDESVIWGSRSQVKIGAVLMGMLVEVGKVAVWAEDPVTKKRTLTMQQAFDHSYQIHFGKRSGHIHMNPKLVEIVAREPPAELLARHLPMVCKPKPWTGPRTGGYKIYDSNLVRTTPGETLQPAYLKAVLKDDGLKEIRTGLDVLGSTGWKINEQVFDVMLEAWNGGEPIGKLAPLNPDLTAPEQPSPDADYKTQKEWHQKVREVENLRSGYHSVRCFQNFQLEVARAFRKEVFYLPHNMDFRGRAYPLPPYMNQMGADNSRGLLLFDKGKALGVSGMRWLKIQIANLFGFDKASMSEREQFTMDNLDDVLDSANAGLHGRRWWLQAEDPWQLLAACCELRNALQLPDPTEYISHLPIHQDGSCNGLQHYAALGGDSVGAQQVNLEPSDRPSDVYTGVCEFVKEAIAQDAANGDNLAQRLEGRVTRKIVKQTVMTNVYGVTFLGATRQVKRQLIDYLPDLNNTERNSAAFYIATKIFGALGSMFNGAHEIQYWLGDCAQRITQSVTPEQIEELTQAALVPKDEREQDFPTSTDPEKSFRSTVIWTTPLGLPVVQPYRTRKTRRVETSLQDISLVEPGSDDVVTKRKQLQAFPPNFIHSLDATHMIMSANACHEAGLTFSAVHDSFWTHAADVDQMNLILRDAFVRMHSDDVVGRLGAEFKVRYSKNLFLARLPRTTRLGRAIFAHRKTTRITKLQELINENRRQTLLNSDDPEDQAEGRAMVTPCSIFEELGGTDTDLTTFKTMGTNPIGHIPDVMPDPERVGGTIDTTDPAIETLVGDLEMFEARQSPRGEISTEVPDDVHGESSDQAHIESQSSQPKEKSKRALTTWLWMPLNFRPVPKKGDWDLTRIRESEYFFS